MGRRSKADIEAAAAKAGEAARAQPTEVRQEPEVEPRVESTDPERVEKLLNARPSVQAMDDIRRRRGEVDDPEVEKPVEAKVEAKVEPEVTAPPVEVVAETPKTVKVKVDGEEIEASQEEVDEVGGVAQFRMMKASENRLRKMNEAAAESKQREERLTKLAESLLQKQTPEAPKVSDQQFIADRLQKIRFGTDEEGAQAQLEIQQHFNKPVDAHAIVEAATTKIKVDQAVETFKTEFPEIMSNQMLLRLAVNLQQEEFAKLQKGQVVDFGNLFRKIGNQIRSAVGRQSQPAPTTENNVAGNPSPATDKEARKATIVNLPKASARAEQPKEEKELSPEEERRASILAMKKARGQ